MAQLRKDTKIAELPILLVNQDHASHPEAHLCVGLLCAALRSRHITRGPRTASQAYVSVHATTLLCPLNGLAQLPFVLDKLARNVIYWKHSNLWRFGACDRYGRLKPFLAEPEA